MKLLYFLISIIFFSFFWLFWTKEYSVGTKKYKDIPEVVFENFTTYQIDKKGVISKLLGESAKKYKDRLEMENFSYFDYKKNEELKAKKGIDKKDTLYFFGNVVYKTKDFQFYSSEAQYDRKNEIIKSKARFKLLTKNSKIFGNSLIYYKNLGKILAKNIDATIYEKKVK